MTRWSRSQLVTVAGIAAVSLVFGILAYHRRWLADDGLIYVRIVDQIRAGNGPVFNVLERVEGNTSALWPWLLAAVGGVTRMSSALAALVVGWLCAVGAVVVAMDACRRWQRARGVTCPLVPVAILVPLGVFAFWDYSTSGLESPLSLLWLAGAFWYLVALRGPDVRERTELVAAFVIGLGPLVRPDLGLPSAVFLVAGWLLLRPTRRRTLALLAAAAALPLAYEIFRAGYYGMLVPNPALTKSATQSAWSRGGFYLLDVVRVYRMWWLVPIGLALAAYYRRRLTGRDGILVAAPVVSGALLALYVVRVGGDFMHARMLLPSAFLVFMPAALLPLQRVTAIAAGLVALWAVITVVRLSDGRPRSRIGDERRGYTRLTQSEHPTDPEQFVRAVMDPALRDHVVREHQLMTENGQVLPKAPHVRGGVLIAGRLGTSGIAAGLGNHVVDTLGLVHPIGSRITMTEPEARPGHQKALPWSWIMAEFGDVPTESLAAMQLTAEDVRAARRALDCGEIAELRAAVREPLTAGRFWDNLVGSVRRTRLVIPANPRDAERRFCP
jgi:arabinofuranosyltransferase